MARALAEALCRVREQICRFQRCWDKSIDGKLCNVYLLGGTSVDFFRQELMENAELTL